MFGSALNSNDIISTMSKENAFTMRERLRNSIGEQLYIEMHENNGLSPLECADIALAVVAEELLEMSLRLGAEANKNLWHLLGSNIADIINPNDMEKVKESQDLLTRAYVIDDLADLLMEGVR